MTARTNFFPPEKWDSPVVILEYGAIFKVLQYLVPVIFPTNPISRAKCGMERAMKRVNRTRQTLRASAHSLIEPSADIQVGNLVLGGPAKNSCEMICTAAK